MRQLVKPKGAQSDPDPIEYVDSIATSSYINAVDKAITQTIRELTSNLESELNTTIYGSSDIRAYIVESELELASKGAGLWIIKSESNNSYRLTLYENVVNVGYLYNSCETKKLAEFYYALCRRTVPRIFKTPTTYQKFENELESVVILFKNRAEKDMLEYIE